MLKPVDMQAESWMDKHWHVRISLSFNNLEIQCKNIGRQFRHKWVEWVAYFTSDGRGQIWRQGVCSELFWEFVLRCTMRGGVKLWYLDGTYLSIWSTWNAMLREGEKCKNLVKSCGFTRIRFIWSSGWSTIAVGRGRPRPQTKFEVMEAHIQPRRTKGKFQCSNVEFGTILMGHVCGANMRVPGLIIKLFCVFLICWTWRTSGDHLERMIWWLPETKNN